MEDMDISCEGEIECDYERQRKKRKAQNHAKLVAAGLVPLAKEVFQDKCQNVSRQSTKKGSQSASCSRDKKGKRPLVQNLPMAEFLEMRRSCRQQQNEQKNKRKIQPDQQQTAQNQLQSSVQSHKIQRKQDLVQQRQSSSQPPQKIQKFCAPGTLSRYKNLRRMQEMRDQQQPRNGNGEDLTSHQPTNVFDGDLRQQQPSNANDGHMRLEMLLNDNEDSTCFSEDVSSDQNEVPIEHDLPSQVMDKADGENEKKHRGKTMLTRIQTRSMNERDVVILNDLHQPVGPTAEVVEDFAKFRGVLANDSNYLPKNYVSWHVVLDALKDKVWEHIKTKFIVPEEGKEWVLGDLGRKWRTDKSRVKGKYYTNSKYKTTEEKLAHPPKDMPTDEFTDLVCMWDSNAGKEISEKNKNNRKKQDDMHIMGPKSLARLRYELQQKDSNKRPPLQADVYSESRKRTDGRKYLTTNEGTLKNIEKIKELKAMNAESGENDPAFAPYPKVMTKKEHSGRMRLFGGGATKSKLKSKDAKTPFIVPSEFLEHITEKIEQSITTKIQDSIAKQMDQRDSYIISRFREANAGVDLVIPDFSSNQRDATSSHDNVDGGFSHDISEDAN